MTEEELENKAKQYSSKYARQYYHNDESSFTTSEEEVYKAYIAGAKEILKENAIAERIIIGEQMEIGRLEKENKELKLLKEKMEDCVNRIKELKEENEKLNQQNEKMKCCYNCESYIDDAYDLCKFCNEFSKWELADENN